MFGIPPKVTTIFEYLLQREVKMIREEIRSVELLEAESVLATTSLN